ncbi:MAG: RNA-binding S4 domain-containing protein [Clostridiales bacterium]|nr:RNA-binding S4 domain-containing protein [Clostridiales bacterium]MCH5165960.1 RNA-binding S4 domain-containing protein [Clostridiales bacterium]
MRIDKFLKVSRIIKRRTVAAEACDAGKVYVNGRSVKPAYTLKIGDVVEVKLGTQPIKFTVKSLNDKAGKEDASSLYEILH